MKQTREIQLLPPVVRKLKSLLTRMAGGVKETFIAAADGDVVPNDVANVSTGGFNVTLQAGKANQQISIVDNTGGSVVTVPNAFNAAGNNTMTFAGIGTMILQADEDGAWHLAGNEGGTPSTV